MIFYIYMIKVQISSCLNSIALKIQNRIQNSESVVSREAARFKDSISSPCKVK